MKRLLPIALCASVAACGQAEPDPPTAVEPTSKLFYVNQHTGEVHSFGPVCEVLRTTLDDMPALDEACDILYQVQSNYDDTVFRQQYTEGEERHACFDKHEVTGDRDAADRCVRDAAAKGTLLERTIAEENKDPWTKAMHKGYFCMKAFGALNTQERVIAVAKKCEPPEM